MLRTVIFTMSFMFLTGTAQAQEINPSSEIKENLATVLGDYDGAILIAMIGKAVTGPNRTVIVAYIASCQVLYRDDKAKMNSCLIEDVINPLLK